MVIFSGSAVGLTLKSIHVPAHVEVGDNARLTCRFDMGSDTLYSVKWYKNDLEFYRYVPNDRPKLQVFSQKGIHVDVSNSLHIVSIFFPKSQQWERNFVK